MKFVHTADVHLVPLSDEDGKRRLEVLGEVCEQAALRDGLVVSGDLFHAPGAAQDAGLRAALKDGRAKAAPKPVLIIPGNHDRPGGAGSHPLDGRYDLGAHVRQLSREPFDEFSIDGVAFYGIPFQTASSGSDLLRRLPKQAQGSVIVLHGTAADRETLAMYASDPEAAEERGDSVFRDADLSAVGAAYFAFGHIHKPEQWALKGGAAAYPGSPDSVAVKEEDERCSLEVELGRGTAVVRRLALSRACRCLRRSFLVVPGAEAAAMREAEDFIKAQPSSVRPVAYLRGLGAGRALDEGRRSLESLFERRDPRPVIKVRADELGDEELAGAGLLKQFSQAMRAAAQEPGADSELIARASLLGWLALRGDKKRLDSVLEQAGGRG